MKISIINGPNLNLLGEREPNIYGKATLEDVNKFLRGIVSAGNFDCDLDFFQSNHEGGIIDRLHECREDGTEAIIINAGAYSHYSYAIRDAISAIRIPCIEVHITNINARDEFRKESVIAPVCAGQINGFGVASYKLALIAAIDICNLKNKAQAQAQAQQSDNTSKSSKILRRDK